MSTNFTIRAGAGIAEAGRARPPGNVKGRDYTESIRCGKAASHGPKRLMAQPIPFPRPPRRGRVGMTGFLPPPMLDEREADAEYGGFFL